MCEVRSTTATVDEGEVEMDSQASIDEDGDNVDDDDGEIERVPFLLQCVSFATFVDNVEMRRLK